VTQSAALFRYGSMGMRPVHTDVEVVYLEVGDRTPGDEGSYSDDGLKALVVDGKWRFVHKNGVPY
jgi:uncharacterized cupin superfamily protein